MIESFNFVGFGGSGSGVAVWKYTAKTFGNAHPDPAEFIQIWDPSDPLLPEPVSAHVMVYAMSAWKNKAGKSDQNDYPPACGTSFGYMKYEQGEIPQRVYAWRGRVMPYPFKYNDSERFCGFNSTPSLNDAMMLPNTSAQGNFHQTDFLATDAETHRVGDWTKVFNGGNGHWYSGGGVSLHEDGPGSSGSIFGHGYDGDIYPGGSGGPGTATARGPAATHIADGVLEEFGLLKLFIKGKPASDDQHADNGAFRVVLPPDLFLFAQLPFQYDASLLKLPESISPARRQTVTSTNMVFAVILEFKQ